MRYCLLCLVPLLVSAVIAGDEDTKSKKPSKEIALQQPKVAIEPRIRNVPDREKQEERSANIRVDTNLVLINVTVTDPMNRFVTGLEVEHFKLLEDKMEQKVTHFASEDAPLSIGLVVDTSHSMGNKLQKARLAVAQFFKTANPEDEFFMVQFNNRPEMVVPFTSNTEEIQNRLTFMQIGRASCRERV